MENKKRERRGRGGQEEEEERKGEEVMEEKCEGKRGLKIAFWNVAEVENKDREFWKTLKDWKVLVLMDKGEKLLKGYR